MHARPEDGGVGHAVLDPYRKSEVRGVLEEHLAPVYGPCSYLIATFSESESSALFL